MCTEIVEQVKKRHKELAPRAVAARATGRGNVSVTAPTNISSLQCKVRRMKEKQTTLNSGSLVYGGCVTLIYEENSLDECR